MAESEGFEPPDLLQSTVFKTAAFDHSANSPMVFDTLPGFYRGKYRNSRLRLLPPHDSGLPGPRPCGLAALVKLNETPGGRNYSQAGSVSPYSWILARNR